MVFFPSCWFCLVKKSLPHIYFTLEQHHTHEMTAVFPFFCVCVCGMLSIHLLVQSFIHFALLQYSSRPQGLNGKTADQQVMSCSSKEWAPVSYWVNQNLISLLLQYNALGNCFQLAQSKSRTEFKYLCFYLMVIQWCTFFFCTFFILYCTSSMAVRHVKPLVLCMHGSYKAVLQYSRWKQNYHLLLLDKITTQQLSKARS